MSVKFIQSGSSKAAQADTGFCSRNLNLLAHAQSIELDIGSLCGGHGICGGDRICLSPADLKDCSPVTSEEMEHLNPEELAQGWRLACQCYPERDDLELQVRINCRS